MQFSLLTLAAAAFGVAGTMAGTVITPSAGDGIGLQFTLEYVSSYPRKVGNTTFLSIGMWNSTLGHTLPAPSFPNDTATTVNARVNVDDTFWAEGEYQFYLTEINDHGEVYGTNFGVTLLYDI